MATTTPERIQSLDIIRGIAVMGIFSVNVVGMAMIEAAYHYPPLYGFGGIGDKVMWAVNFLIVDGRFRSLFSILFGASMLLVIERAEAAGKSPAKVHFARMAVLLLFGLAHYYLFWWGDILANYALVGMIAYFVTTLPVRQLAVGAGLALSLLYVPAFIMGITQLAAPEIIEQAEALSNTGSQGETAIAAPSPAESDEALAKDIADAKQAYHALAAHFDYVIEKAPFRPFTSVVGYGAETLGLMMLGMIGFKTGFLTGRRQRRHYARVALATLAPMFAYHAFAIWGVAAAGFDRSTFDSLARMLPMPFHPLGAIGYAAVIMLVFANSSGIGDRLAAVGRAAFTNYLGCTMVGTLLFYDFGLGLFGELSRGEAWLIVPAVWAFMLLWSKWWLDRFRYGPFEWAWRSLSRWRWEPMRRVARADAPA